MGVRGVPFKRANPVANILSTKHLTKREPFCCCCCPMICYHRALFRNETTFQIWHFFISPNLFNPRIRMQRYNHKDGVGEHNWAPFRRTRNVCRSYMFSSADHSSHILCDADENDFASCLTEMLGWGWQRGWHAAAIAKLRFYSFARQLGKLSRCTCS